MRCSLRAGQVQVGSGTVEQADDGGVDVRDAEVRGDGHVPGALDEIPTPVVVTRSGRAVVGMDMIIRRSLTPLNSSRTTGASAG
jgi:hypothetical protein